MSSGTRTLSPREGLLGADRRYRQEVGRADGETVVHDGETVVPDETRPRAGLASVQGKMLFRRGQLPGGICHSVIFHLFSYITKLIVNKL